MRTLHKIDLQIGKLKLPISLYKAKDTTISIRAKEVIKVNGNIYPVKKKPYYINEAGQEVDIDSSQILKQYEKDDLSIALFTKDEQKELLKMGSQKVWSNFSMIDKSKFNELSFQKDGIIGQVEILKDKNLINRKNLKFFKMLKEGLKDKILVTQTLYRNIEYPIAISNYGDNLLIRFISYSDEVRAIEGQELPQLTEKETEQARAFVQQYFKPDFDLNQFENKTEERVMKIINSRGTDVTENKTEELILEEDNPFSLEGL